MDSAFDSLGSFSINSPGSRDGLSDRLRVLLENAEFKWETDLPSAKALVEEASHLLRAKRVLPLVALNKSRAIGGLAGWQISRVTEYIETNLAETIRIDALSDLARLSTTYFARAFRQEFSCSPHQYILNRRIERAKALLFQPNLALSEIALMCGFADQSHLSRTFGRLVGSSPVSWRREKYSQRR